jgi:hypothetical protein
MCHLDATPSSQWLSPQKDIGCAIALVFRVDVLRLIAQGLANRDIAESLVLSEGTVKNHVSAIIANYTPTTGPRLAASASACIAT